jgi:aryl-phospho-beta-D-glucosidase BglC (GH1 family)
MKNKLKGRIVSALSAATIAATAMGALPTATIEADALSGLNAWNIVSQIKIGWNLGNTLECNNTNLSSSAAPKEFAKAWGQPEPTAEQFKSVKNAGFNAVRIPVTWYEHLEYQNGKYHVNDTWMEYVKKTVDYAIDEDMFVILNIHHEDFINAAQWNENTYSIAEQKLTNIWTELAEEFKSYDQHLIFEGMNEPRQTGNSAVSEWGNGSGDNGYSWSYVNRLNEAFVRTVRNQGTSQNRERLLMLPGYVASSDYTAINNIAIPSNAGNVALSVHAYAPYYFTMATDEKANHSFPGQSGWGENYESSLTDMFNNFGQLQQQKGAPIIIGEFSASDFGNTNDRARWANYYLSRAKEKGIPCFLWDNNVPNNGSGEAHGYMHRKSTKWYPDSMPVIQAMMRVYGISSNMEEYYVGPFSWETAGVGSNWVQLYKSDSGNTIAGWKNFTVSNWKNYVNENYDLVLFYDSDTVPELVLMGSDWNRIASSDDTGTPHTMRFTYDDIVSAVAKNSGQTVSQQDELFISATNSPMTAYGLFAVPKSSTPQPQNTDYPKNIKVEHNDKYHQLRFSWDKVEGATNYGIAVFLAGKWRMQGSALPASTLTYTTPKNLTVGKSYKVAIAAKVNGQWTTTQSTRHAITVTVK